MIVMSEFITNKNYAANNRSTKTLKEYEKNETKERKRNLLYLISSYLRERNLQETADTLNVEAQLTNQYEVCDNIDLDIILQDFQSYYHTKFNKMPRIVKKVEGDAELQAAQWQKRKNRSAPFTVSTNGRTTPQKINQDPNADNNSGVDNFRIAVKPLGQKKTDADSGTLGTDYADCENKLCSKALCDFKDYSSEWREMADLIVKEIVPKNLGVSWNDCVGMEYGIDILKETVIYPQRHPNVFIGLATPWRGVLMFGPPGTGKTHLAKAVACESASTFINVRSSSFISKWRGESEKMLKVLFDVAKFYQPSTIFIDEIDAIASRHEDTQHDASRRFKSELLIQMDGILNGDEQVFVLATTNSPWNLDPAILRRFEKRILLNAPAVRSRKQLFQYFFSKHSNAFQECDYDRMAQLTDNFSGSDIKVVCREVIMNILREKINIENPKGSLSENELRKPTVQDVINAINKTSPTSNVISIEKYNSWYKNYGNH